MSRDSRGVIQGERSVVGGSSRSDDPSATGSDRRSISQPHGNWTRAQRRLNVSITQRTLRSGGTYGNRTRAAYGIGVGMGVGSINTTSMGQHVRGGTRFTGNYTGNRDLQVARF